VVAINDALTGDPGLVNKEPTGAGWFFKLKTGDTAQFAGLMDQAAYDAYVKGLG
jgi:glycine cleavage system H protein